MYVVSMKETFGTVIICSSLFFYMAILYRLMWALDKEDLSEERFYLSKGCGIYKNIELQIR